MNLAILPPKFVTQVLLMSGFACIVIYMYIPNLIIFYMDGCPGCLASCFLAHMLGSNRTGL